MNDIAPWLAFAAAAYLVGSIPFGLLIGFARGVDVRAHGSGNIGATNVMRVLGRPLGFVCLALDLVKGAGPVLLAGWVMETLGAPWPGSGAAATWLGVAAAALLGHVYPPWLRLRGGKGVATGFGALLAMWPLMTVPVSLAFVVWAVALAATRYVGVSSCLAAISLPVWTLLLGLLGPRLGWQAWPTPGDAIPFLGLLVALAALVIWRHRGNLARTWAGAEPKAGAPSNRDHQKAAPGDSQP